MGFFRGGTLAIVCLLLFLSTLSLLTFSTLKSSSSYENINEELSNKILNIPENPAKEQISENPFIEEGIKIRNKANQTIPLINEHCNIAQNYTFIYEENTFVISCSEINTENIIAEKITSKFIEDAYYKDYGCSFWSCLIKGETAYYLISNQARDYWSGKFNFVLISTLVLAGIAFILVEQRVNWPIIVGSTTILASVTLFKIQGVVYKIIFSKNIKGTSYIKEIIFSKSASTFTFAITLGIVIIGVGIYLRFFHSDLIEKRFSEKDVKNIIREEKAKENLQNMSQQKNPNKTKKNKTKKSN
ncbi:MAG: hypothetical protein KKC19_01335 [Nanoarchaeota archaeon]|nr:hypothetical protein [Nanoarchaeota archaeon]